ncbi:MAG: O-antigen ligase family protein [Planctomycetota bacterium]|nr:O-antigen ligase family protein [Planctomycetota bacterium]
MPLFRDIPTPDATASQADCIEWAARRDPIGHRVHLSMAMIALFCIPLASSPATVSSTILFGYTLLRAPTLWRTWRALPSAPVMIATLLVFVWLGMSTSWSSDAQQGIRLLRGSRYLLLIPALVPLLAHRDLLLRALTAGILFQCGAQYVEYLVDGNHGLGGLSEHPGHTCLWYSLALGYLAFSPSPRTHRWGFRVPLFVIIILGAVLTAARSAFAGLIGGLLVAVVVGNPLRRRGASLAVVAGGLLAVAGIASTTHIGDRIVNAWEGMTTPYEGGVFDIEGNRITWWKIGLQEWTDHPVLGTGIGSAGRIIANDPHIQYIVSESPENKHVIRDDFHSTFITMLTESGAVGLLLLCAWMILLACTITGNRNWRLVLITGYVTWIAYCVLNTTLFSGRLVAFPSTLLALSLVPEIAGDIGLRSALGVRETNSSTEPTGSSSTDD